MSKKKAEHEKGNQDVHRVNFSNLPAVFVMFRLISAAISENSLRGWWCLCLDDPLNLGEESKERRSNALGAWLRARIRSTIPLNSLVRSLKFIIVFLRRSWTQLVYAEKGLRDKRAELAEQEFRGSSKFLRANNIETRKIALTLRVNLG